MTDLIKMTVFPKICSKSKMEPSEVKHDQEGHVIHGKNYGNNQMQAGCLDGMNFQRFSTPR